MSSTDFVVTISDSILARTTVSPLAVRTSTLPAPAAAVYSDFAADTVTPSLKRPAESEPEVVADSSPSRKKMKEDVQDVAGGDKPENGPHAIDGHALAEDLAQELQCGCCSELVYKPVIVSPCEHFFCGSCCTLWVKNGGTNCPACRCVSTSVAPSRMLQSMIDVLLRAVPHRQRTERERIQADEVYPVHRVFKIPAPREPSPEPTIPTSADFVQPCPHCAAGNAFNWTCPQPIPDPATDAEHSWHINNGAPPGHGFCGNCEVILALNAPSTTRCDFCQVSFCGINVQSRCIAFSIGSQSPHGLSDINDLIQCPDVYDCFDGDTVEVDYMIEYMTAHRKLPKHVYRQIAAHIANQPGGFRSLIEQEMFVDIHAVSAGTDPDPEAPRRSICRCCALEIFLHGLRDWWIRERRIAVAEGRLMARKDCPEGRMCRNKRDIAHSKEFNHLISEEPSQVPESNQHHQAPIPSSDVGFILDPTPSRSSSPRRTLPSLPGFRDALQDFADFSLPPFAMSSLAMSSGSGLPLFMREASSGNHSITSDLFSVNAAPDVEPLPESHQESQRLEAPSTGYVAQADNSQDAPTEPSSSQSREAVEASMMLGSYESDSESEREPPQQEDNDGARSTISFDLGDVYTDSYRTSVTTPLSFGDTSSAHSRADYVNLGSKVPIDMLSEQAQLQGALSSHSAVPMPMGGSLSSFGIPDLHSSTEAAGLSALVQAGHPVHVE